MLNGGEVTVVIKEALAARRKILLVVLTSLIGWLIAGASVSAQSTQIEARPIGLHLIAQGFTAPVQVIDPFDGTDRLFVVDQIGQIRIVNGDGILLPEPFLDIADRIVELRATSADERGLLGLAFHPAFVQNGRFFVYYSAPLRPTAPPDFDHTGRISEFRVSPQDPNRADPASERVILEVDQPQSNHNGGTLSFGPDGYLYISLGDGGAANDVGLGHVEDWYPFNEGGNGQDVTQNLLGSILRIDVDTGDPYAVPPDNPFVGRAGLEEIYAYGLRNPYRMSFDPTGEFGLFSIDAGQHLWEEINIIVSGGNYGWNVKEGTHCFGAASPTQPPDQCPNTVGSGHPGLGGSLIDPVVEFANSKQAGGLGLTVTDARMYRGTAIPSLQGLLVFSTWSITRAEPQGRLFYAVPSDTGLWQFGELVPTQNIEGTVGHFVLGMGQDQSGELYIGTRDEVAAVGQTGRVYQLVSALQPADSGFPHAFESPCGNKVNIATCARVNDAVDTVAARFNLPRWFLYAIIERESGFNPGAINTTDIFADTRWPGRGLTQVSGPWHGGSPYPYDLSECDNSYPPWIEDKGLERFGNWIDMCNVTPLNDPLDPLQNLSRFASIHAAPWFHYQKGLHPGLDSEQLLARAAHGWNRGIFASYDPNDPYMPLYNNAVARFKPEVEAKDGIWDGNPRLGTGRLPTDAHELGGPCTDGTPYS